jgi:hypothetical protein
MFGPWPLSFEITHPTLVLELLANNQWAKTLQHYQGHQSTPPSLLLFRDRESLQSTNNPVLFSKVCGPGSQGC